MAKLKEKKDQQKEENERLKREKEELQKQKEDEESKKVKIVTFRMSKLNRRKVKILAVSMQLKQLQKKKPEKNSGLNGIQTHDLCDAGAVLYQLSYQANWELVVL